MTAIETAIRRLMDRQQLARVDITSLDGKRFVAIAYPTSYHPAINERRLASFAGKTNLTIADAQAIENEVQSRPLATSAAETIESAITGLATKLS